MGANVGNINLGLNVDYAGFNSQLTGIKKQAEGSLTSAFKGLGKVAAAAFSISAITKFTKSCLDLGSALSEVQNVVDVTFGPEGAKTIESFSKSAMTSLGLSELKAKKYTSTLGAMYKSMGISTDKALGMSIEMTKLAGDMASFYNLDADEAFNKIRAGISGETEPLKQLGINMSVANLEAYALSQGITTSYNSMNQASQAMLRYKYLLSVTSDAQGDFARTSDSWANQTRILKLQFESLKSTLGQAFITVLTPVIRVINTLMAKLVQLASVFNSFISMLFGKKGGSALGGASEAADSTASAIADASDSASNIGEGLAGGAGSAKKIKKALAGFDELMVLDFSDAGGGGGGAEGIDIGEFDFDTDTTPLDEATDKVDKLTESLNKFLSITGFDTFFDKIKTGFNSVNWAGIGENFKSIGNDLIPIAKAICDGLLSVLRSWLSMMGSIIGGLVGVLGDALEIITGGVAKFLRENGARIANWVTEWCDKWATGFDNLATMWDSLFGSLRNALASHKDSLMNTISGVLTAISNLYMAVYDIVADIFLIATEEISKFVTENAANIEAFFSSIFSYFEEFYNFIAQVINGIASVLSDFWNSYGKEIWRGIVSAITDVMGWIMKLWTTVIQPVFSYIISVCSELWTNHLQPLLSKIASFLGEVGILIINLWNGFLKPIVNWIINTLGPIVVSVVKSVVNVVKAAIAAVSDILGGLITFLKGIIQFISGVFTGDWSKAWEGIKNIFGGLIDTIVGIFKGAWDILSSILALQKETFKATWEAIKGVVVAIVKSIATFLSNTWNMIKSAVSSAFNAIKTTISNIWNAVKTTTSNIWNGIKTTITTIINAVSTTISNTFNSIKTTITNILNAIKTTFSNVWNSIKTTVTTIVNSLSSALSTAWNNIKNGVSTAFNAVKTTFSTIWNSIKSTVSGIVTGISTGISTAFNNIKSYLSNTLDAIKTTFSNVWNAIATAIKSPINAIINGLNKLITGLNRIKIDIPSWVPSLGGKQFGFNIPHIPALANGGIVSAPMIAQVGDNPRSDEVVSPLHELLPMIASTVATAVAAAFANQPRREEGDINIPIYLNDTLLDDVIVTAEQRRKLRTGGA